MSKTNNRYTVEIRFHQNTALLSKRTPPLVFGVKTLREADKYKELIDDSVREAFVLDNVKNIVIEYWVQDPLKII